MGKELTEVPRPAMNGLIAVLDAALGQEVFDVTEAQREPKVQPHRSPNDVRREPMARIGDRLSIRFEP